MRTQFIAGFCNDAFSFSRQHAGRSVFLDGTAGILEHAHVACQLERLVGIHQLCVFGHARQTLITRALTPSLVASYEIVRLLLNLSEKFAFVRRPKQFQMLEF